MPLQDELPYIATHLDDRCPTQRGFIPDAGGIAALLEKTSGRIPRVFGKPNKEMLTFKLDNLGISKSDAIMFGDRLYTDMKMGRNAHVDTCCVLSGETTMQMIKESNTRPTYIIEGVWELTKLIN
ncbi:MAG: HAD hydrolase-like protein [Candidatus Lokiarchaeota archaeon]